ncbi:hybrid sensor histidine kinase/response regulator [Halopseudomonas xiamenensis]|uniref:hybrid sensor histidine kinase/response regulator n=1 Tax=Halopseudomonas xiamenensis TaxID=157792 RepID=UPI0016265493|nr:PAS domain-containing hybrid sensor histidine kinase/response regulator [Halopseudomonas xiamenensis]
MMLSGGLVASTFLVYMACLFAIAFWGDRQTGEFGPRLRVWVYSLSLAVWCTSWTFFGAVGMAAGQVWDFLPIYIGPMILFILGWRLIARMLAISKQENITSIADFIASRYGKSQSLGVIVAALCLVSVLPYIALQLKGIVLGFNLLTGAGAEPLVEGAHSAEDTALVVTLVLALFTILFGTRSLDATEHHRGMMLAIAFESMVKLLAFLAVGVFVTFSLFGGITDLLERASNSPALADYWQRETMHINLLFQTFIAILAFICLPRQFQVAVVENIQSGDLRVARWVFPAYLLLAGLFVIPISLAGQLNFGTTLMPDSYVINLPLMEGRPVLALLAFLGGASAATGMVIVAAIALSTMVSNDVVMPLLLRNKNQPERSYEEFRGWMLNVRRSSILIILLLAYVVYRMIGSAGSLANTGQIAFAAIAQLAPAMFGALFWKQANRSGVFAGLLVGISLWFYLLILPLLDIVSVTDWPVLEGMYDNAFGLPVDSLTLGSIAALSCNFVVFVLVSLFSRTRVLEHWQASRFVSLDGDQWADGPSRSMLRVTVDDLLMLAARFVGEERARAGFERFAEAQETTFNPTQVADSSWITQTERLLAGVLGASSARVVVKAAIEGRAMHFEDVVRIVDEASEVLQFNRGLLQGAIENITQGISVVDKELRLVAWNQRYLEMFQYPEGLITIGRPIADLILCNARRGLCGPGDPQMHMEKRVNWMRRGTAHRSERLFPNGRVIEIIGNPMPGGGFVMSFTDITAFREAERALKESNEGLEQRVVERTRELSELNEALLQAKAQTEQTSQSKSRFLTAVSHDLMQPMNAARLFSASLAHQPNLPAEAQELVRHLDTSLRSAEDLISDLLDLSRLESGRITPEWSDLVLTDLIEPLRIEFGALAVERGVDLRVHSSRLRVRSDIRLLRRVLQNFLTNAFRYAGNSRVVLGMRRLPDGVRIEVWDQGPGIPRDKLQTIFEEFKRLDNHRTQAEKGLGLGLAIADGLCRVLGHELSVRSWPGRGSVFSVMVPVVRYDRHSRTVSQVHAPMLSGAQVLCIDNEATILTGMQSLLSRWQCNVAVARDRSEVQAVLDSGFTPELVLADYHLDDGDTGLELVAWLRERINPELPGVVISADGRNELITRIRLHGLDYLPKPVKPAALRALISRYVSL